MNRQTLKRAHIEIAGAVQGVGFRPFIYRLAVEMELSGWVGNTAQGVIIEIEGPPPRVDWFVRRIHNEKPPHSLIQTCAISEIPVRHSTGFSIQSSDTQGTKSALLLPDLATCRDCCHELFDPFDRRYRYPFINCTHCGPRFSIIESLPYDRANTSMKPFTMCPECNKEYHDPLNRRFHAQPNACPACGPHLELWDDRGQTLSTRHDALLLAVDSIQHGKIVAVKGIGGFHLVCDARRNAIVHRLRTRKHREEKPFAMMLPSLDFVDEICRMSEFERSLLQSPESPIVLLKKKPSSPIAGAVAPGNPYWGVMLPYTPLHHLLMADLGIPVVATSGNLSDEPICIDEHEALVRLKGIADYFLIHDRPIVRHVDDSIVREMCGREMILRRARGYAPLPVDLKTDGPTVLAVGAHLKNTVALNVGTNCFISQHIGDLETEQAYLAFQEVITSFQTLYEAKPDWVVSDLHPDYLSTKYAHQLEVPLVQIQHHYAHVVSCMAENEITETVLGVAWDGTGYGEDQTIWGGEFLQCDYREFKRVAHFRPFPLPSGEQAIKHPKRTALGLLYEIMRDSLFEQDDLELLRSFQSDELTVMRRLLDQSIQCPMTSSVGRLFDAVASLMNMHQAVSFEGQAAMELENIIEPSDDVRFYPYTIIDNPTVMKWVIDWEPMIQAILHEIQQGESNSTISTRFHNTLVEIIMSIAKRVGKKSVVLSGGCFQNKYLTEKTVARLIHDRFQPVWHRLVPPNDGGISLGQVVAATHQSTRTQV